MTASSETLLSVERVVKHYPIVRAGLLSRQVSTVRAVEDVSFELRAGETLAVVGESGCGKSTLARMLVRLERPSSGRIVFRGEDVAPLSKQALKGYRKRVQLVFQDAYSSLNPSMTVGALVAEPWRIHDMVPRAQLRSRAEEMLASVGVDPSYYDRRPGELSGGERQRVGIARALALEPEVLVCDEPASALDVSVQAQILMLLRRLQTELGLSYVFISHDLSVVRYVAHRVAVMYLGQLVELGACDQIYAAPRHPYTRGLLESARHMHGEAKDDDGLPLPGDTPNAADPPPGCRFHPRCRRASDICRHEQPALERIEDGRVVACHHPEPTGPQPATSARDTTTHR